MGKDILEHRDAIITRVFFLFVCFVCFFFFDVLQHDQLDFTGHKVSDFNPNIMVTVHPTPIDIKVPDLIPLAWQYEADIWVDQWPILEPRLFVSKELVLEQLSLSHLESLSSIHNTF